MLSELTRRQIIIWAAVGAAIFLLGAVYLYRNWPGGSRQPFFAATTTVAAGAGTNATASVWVHVTGAVVSPGLYELQNGDRVADAIETAGGALPEADLSRVNLAAKVADGQQVLVPAQGAAAAAGGGGEGTGPVSLNSATLDELTRLDGVGPKTAQKIIEYREAHGGFRSVEELMEVPGIGPAKFEQLRGQVTL